MDADGREPDMMMVMMMIKDSFIPRMSPPKSEVGGNKRQSSFYLYP